MSTASLQNNQVPFSSSFPVIRDGRWEMSCDRSRCCRAHPDLVSNTLREDSAPSKTDRAS